jgi:DNA-binding NarL/FixJ family response regulator
MDAPDLPADSSDPVTAARAVRVAVIDDDTLVREGVALRLPEIDVVCEAATVAEFLTRAPGPDEVDVVLLDLRLTPAGRSGVQGRNAVVTLAELGYRVLVYSNDERPIVLAGCLAAGARGFVHKRESAAELREALAVVARGRSRISSEVAGVAEYLANRGYLPTLTPRQVQVLQGRARGESYKRLGRRLGLTDRTVEDYMSQVTDKFSDYFAHHSAADLEHDLGLGPNDLLT